VAEPSALGKHAPDPPVSPGYHLAQGRLARMLPLVGLTLRSVGEHTAAAISRGSADSAIAARHGRTAERYVELLGRSRGVLMKAGQLLSVVGLQAVVSQEHQAVYQALLARLQDDAPPMPAGLAADVAEAELGCPLHEVFDDFDPHPIAAASIGQVHAARLLDGRDVAVKIQYPGVERAIAADLRNSELLAAFLRLGAGLTRVRPDLVALARELTARISEEIDYQVEAANQEAFAAAYRGHPLIRIPQVVPHLCTRRVLVSELSDGMRWSQARACPQPLRDRWGEVLFRFAVGSLTRLGMLNADPQPGNYLFHADGAVTFLDFGCVRRYTACQVHTVRSAVQAAVDADAAGLHRILAEAGYISQADPPDSGALLTWLRQVLTPVVAPQPFTYSPDFAAALVSPDLAPRGPYADVISRLTMPAEFLSVVRVNLGLTAVLAELHATANWEAIRREYCAPGRRSGRYAPTD
jgi:predicted unusual protein kinase regulating ubiquinone biosynthesis (AarF/ABC1/UbiB family)